MKIDKEVFKTCIKIAEEAGYLEVRDHRGNTIVLSNGKFSVNGFVQSKTKKARDTIFFESLKLSRFVKINDQEYVRKGRRWIKSEKVDNSSRGK